MIRNIIIIAAPALAAAVVIIAAVIVIRKKRKEVHTPITETPGTAAADNKDEENFEPVTAAEDISVTFSDVSTDYAAAMEDFNLQTELTTAVKPETVSQLMRQTAAAKPEKPKKNSVTPEQHLEVTIVRTENPAAPSDKAVHVIESFFNGQYYFDGEMISGDEKNPMEIAMNGDDFQVFSEMDGQDVAIMKLSGKIYLLNPDTKKYTELNNTIKKITGLDDSTFDFSFNKIKFNASEPTAVTEATHNGRPAVCHTYQNSETKLEFITVNDEIKQMVLFNEDDKPDTVLEADEFTAEIPAEMLNFKGYSKTNIISFMSSMM